MKAQITKKLTLELNEEEIRYLQGITQNYLGEDIANEDPKEAEMRLNFFVETSRALGFDMDDNGCLIDPLDL